MDEARQDQATLYVLRMLPPAEALAFAREMEANPELQDMVRELENTASTVALAAPLRRPPSSLRSRVLAAIGGDSPSGQVAARGVMDWIPWTMAAALALAAGTFWYEARSVREGLTAVQAQLEELRQRDTLATTQIATLSAQVSEYQKALAVVVYDQQRQAGVVKLDRFPKAEQGKDYQLWLIDPKGGKPVSAGVLQAPESGAKQVSFRPERRLPDADTFAISVEPAGGSAEPRGQVILVGK
jgi:anti-sigma-K factor RskA